MHTIKYSLYPNNEVRAVHYYSRPRQSVNDAIETEGVDLSCPVTASVPLGEVSSTDSLPLDISSDFSQSPENKMRKRTKFGTSAKRTILRLGGAYDTVDSTPQNYVFLTGTIPGGTHDAFMAVAENSPYIVKSLAEWLKRTCPTKYWFYVWELQQRGALHIHYCVHAPDSTVREKILSGWWTKWHSIIQEVGVKSDTDMWIRKDGAYHKEGHSVLQAYAQTVHKSVAAYMAGYCSNSKDKHSSDATSPYYPTRWWGCSRESTKLLRGLTKEIVVEHNSYRDARYEIQSHYERVLHDSPKAHSYPHKVGIGTTVVSYHPEDKGQSIWNQFQTMRFSVQTFPNASSWIAALEDYIQTWVLYCKALRSRNLTPYLRLLQDCEDILSQGSLSRSTLHQSTLRTVHRLNSALSLNMLVQANPGRNMNVCVPPLWMLERVNPYLQYDRNGWLNLENDFPVRLTDCWAYGTISTNEPDGSDAVREAAHGSLSPRNLPLLPEL